MKFFLISSLSLEFLKENNLNNKYLIGKIIKYTNLYTDSIYITNDFINFFLTQSTADVDFLELLSLLNNKKKIIIEVDQIGLSLLKKIILFAGISNNIHLVLNPAFFCNQTSKILNFDFYFNYIKEYSALPVLIKLYPLLNKLNYNNSQINELIGSPKIRGLIFNTEMAEDFDLIELGFFKSEFNKLLLSDSETMIYPLFKNGIDGIITDDLSKNPDFFYKIKDYIDKSKFKLAKELQINYNNKKISSEMKVRK